MHPLILDARGRELFFTYFLCIYPYFLTFTYTIFQKTPSLDAPAWMPGPSHTRHPPLHATDRKVRATMYFIDR